MKAAGLSELKKEFQLLAPGELIELLINIAKYKKDNKEYLGYLLFEAHNKNLFVKEIKKELDGHFAELGKQANLYYVKKGLRKILRILNKYCKYLNDKALSAEVHIYFTGKLKNSGIAWHKSQLIVNLYAQQLKKINSFISGLHEDLQQDYLNDVDALTLN
jgi:hypothetical protein